MKRWQFLALAVFGALLVGAWAGWRFWYVPHVEANAHLEANVEACSICLPNGLTLSTEFSDSHHPISPGTTARRVITVRQKLIQIGAYCKNGVIYDRTGKEVFFYHVTEWGNPPVNYRELQEKARQELRRLEAQGTVIRMWQTRVPI
jgi:hypothetical protein